MTHQANGQAEPLCKFGPGGDFITEWQPELTEPSRQLSFLAKFLTSTLEIMAIPVGLRQSNLPADPNGAICSDEDIVCPQEKAKDVVASSKTTSTIDSAPATTIKDGRVLPTEPMLFPDNSRAGSQIKHKPKYRIRTYRRAAKKRFAFGPSEQGSLFELDFQRARTA